MSCGKAARKKNIRFLPIPDTEQTQLARTQLNLYAIKKLGAGLSLCLSIDNVTRKGHSDDSLEYLDGTLSQREIDRVKGVRIANLSLVRAPL